MIIVAITGPSMKEAFRQVSASSRYADAFEYRLDLITKPLVRALFASTSKPTVATCRPAWEGGRFAGSEPERERLLVAALQAGATYVDIELNASPLMRLRLMDLAGRGKVIISHHAFSGPLPETSDLYECMCGTGAGIVKYAYVADDSSEAWRAFEFLSRAKADHRKAVAMALGGAGEVTRVLYRKLGGWATYAAPETGEGSAPGQIPASHLKNLYRANRLNGATKVFGVVGNPIQQSKGVYIHNELFRRAGTNAVYCRFQVQDLDAFMKKLAPLLNGFSVTLPHKQEVMRYLGSVDRHAAAIGAVNTVLRGRKGLQGSNTDAAGALDAIENVQRVKGRTLLVIGAGGAARAIAFEAKRRGAEIAIANRTEEKAVALARELGARSVPMKGLPAFNFDVLVNATPVGMVPRTEEMPVPPSILGKKLVFDAIYNPPVTRLLAEAKRRGATVVRGTEMYVNQAALQSRLFTGRRPSTKRVKKLLDKQFRH